jgi:LuxR family maltose regulon positive regulatory protein
LRWAISLKQGREEVEARLLRTEVLQRQGATDSRTAPLEAVSLAQASGMHRLLHEVQADRETVSPPPFPDTHKAQPQWQTITTCVALHC